MIINIDDKFQITSDEKNYILQEKKVVAEGKSKGTEYYTPIGYYGKITTVLKAYKEKIIRRSDVKTVEELIQLIENIDQKIEKMLKGN